MDLPGDLEEPERGVQVAADRVLLEGLDLGDGHPLGAEAGQGVLEQPAAQPLAAQLGGDRQVVNPADPRLARRTAS